MGSTSVREAWAVAKNIGQAIRAARVQLKLSQEEAASRAKMTPPAFNRLELGRGDPRWSTVVRVAAALGMTLDELVAGYTERAALLQPAVPTAELRGALRAVKRDLLAATTRVEELEARFDRRAPGTRARPNRT